MTQQEQQLLEGLVQRVNGTQLQSKDADAERYLAGALGSNADAIYILCQTVLVQQFAMENSQHELATLRTQLQQLQQQPAKSEEHTSFLGNLFGLKKDPQPQTISASSAAQSGYQPVHDPGPAYPPQAGYPPQQSYPQQGYPPQYGGQPGYPPPPGYGYGAPMGGGMFGGGGGGMFGGGGGGFLAGAAQTAAGVVAGEMAFRALEDVFSSGHHGIGGFGQPQEIVNNNYYDDNSSRDSGGSSFGDRLGAADGFDNNAVSSDIEDRRGENSGSGFFGGGGDDSSNFADDSGIDDSGDNDDSGSYDDGGGSDDSGGSSDDSGF